MTEKTTNEAKEAKEAKESISKSVVVLTSFWDASTVIDHGYFLHKPVKDNNIYRININKEDCNFSVNSIALRPPTKTPKYLEKMSRLDFFCPTYDMLKRYKNDNNWDSYKKDYYNLIKKRKDQIKEWINSLKKDHIYFLCCWENTSTGANCHRELIYKAFRNSTTASEKILPIYRHGEKIKKQDYPGYDSEQGFPLRPSTTPINIIDINIIDGLWSTMNPISSLSSSVVVRSSPNVDFNRDFNSDFREDPPF